MIQRIRFIGVAVLSILVLTIIGANFLSPAYATCIFNGSLSSLSITQGTSSVTVSGTDGCNPSPPGTGIDAVQLWSGACPGVTMLSSVNTAVSSPFGSFSQNILTSSLSPGSYCVVVHSNSPTASPPDLNDPFTVTAVIPEYPLGLSLLAIFMIIAYGVIRRKTRND